MFPETITLTAGLQQFRIGRQVFEAQIHRSPYSSSPVDHTGRNDGALPGTEIQDLTSGYLDLKLTFNDKKQLVRSWMPVPGILATNDSQSETARVHLAEHLIAMALGHTCRFGSHINDSQWRMTNGFVDIRVRRWNGRGQVIPYFSQVRPFSCPPGAKLQLQGFSQDASGRREHD